MMVIKWSSGFYFDLSCVCFPLEKKNFVIGISVLGRGVLAIFKRSISHLVFSGSSEKKKKEDRMNKRR